jgi:hypothetical protein
MFVISKQKKNTNHKPPFVVCDFETRPVLLVTLVQEVRNVNTPVIQEKVSHFFTF